MSRSWNELVQSFINGGILRTPCVIRSLRMVPRELFLPEGERSYASVDSPLPIGNGQTVSAPLD